MLTNTRLAIYIAFIVALAVWVGGGVFDTLHGHPAWYANPVAYVRTQTAPEGAVNPWPLTTAVLALCTLAALAVFARYRGPGRRVVLLVLAGIVVILIATGVYFVPTLGKLSNHAALTDAQIIAISHTWMRLNVIRIVLLLGLLTCSLLGLVWTARERGDELHGLTEDLEGKK